MTIQPTIQRQSSSTDEARNLELLDRKSARSCGEKWYFTGLQCKHGHVCKRLVSDGSCHQCNLNKQKAKRDANPQKAKARVQAWRENSREKISEYNKRKYYSDAKFARERSASYKAKHREKVLASLKVWQDENRDARKHYVKNNRHRYRAYAMTRNANKLKATPPWVNWSDIEAVYQMASKLADETGKPFHVDHIVPLQSKMVCGLHVAANLRVLSASENMSKGNHWWPDMWQ
jgi:hypothetical protein